MLLDVAIAILVAVDMIVVFTSNNVSLASLYMLRLTLSSVLDVKALVIWVVFASSEVVSVSVVFYT